MVNNVMNESYARKHSTFKNRAEPDKYGEQAFWNYGILKKTPSYKNRRLIPEQRMNRLSKFCTNEFSGRKKKHIFQQFCKGCTQLEG